MAMDMDDEARLRAAFAAPEPPRGNEPPGASGVLIPIFEVGGEPHLLFTRRALTLSSHPGEISFPGGRVDPGDGGPRDAALREAEEETGIRPADVTVLGHLTDYMTFRGTLVCAYVGLVEGDPPREPASPLEVADILVVPVRDLLREDVYEGRTLPDGPREGVVHYWHLPQGVIWGITGELVARFLRRTHGWEPPRPPRVIHHLSEFIPERDGTSPDSRA